ncbi:MAG: hypothetical protein V4638_06345 [Bacteroidota bacterium]
METRKINLDRKPLDTEQIQSKQNFQHILSQYKYSQIPVWKKPLFYGVIGLSSIALVLTIGAINFDNKEATNVEIVSSKTTQQKLPATKIAVAGFSPTSKSKKPAKAQKVKEIKVREMNYSLPMSHADIAPPSATTDAQAPQKKKSKLPSIGGLQEGVISIDKLCSDPTIRFEDENLKVVSFKLLLTGNNDGISLNIQGDKIPTNVCEALKKEGNGQLMFITDIISESSTSKYVSPAMNFQIIASN